MAGVYTIALFVWLTVIYSTVNGQFNCNTTIENVVIPLNESSVTVNCPTANGTNSIVWFNAASDTMVATGNDYNISATGSYYCQVTERRGIFRSNTFTVYRTSFADNFSIHPKNFTVYSDTTRVAFECRINTFIATQDDASRLSIVWEASSNNIFTQFSSDGIFNPLPGYSILVMDYNETFPVMFRCQAIFMPIMGAAMVVATSDVAYIENISDILDLGSTSGPPDNRTFLLTPSNEVITQMDTAAFVCVAANSSVEATWSSVSTSAVNIGNNTFYLVLNNVMENASVSCTIEGESVIASIIVQEGPAIMADMILPAVTAVMEGTNITLRCLPEMTYPTPSITWLANGTDVQVTTGNYTISPISASSEIIYQCLVEGTFVPSTNSIGLPPTISFITTTVIDCVPVVMVMVVGITDVNGDGVHDVRSGTSFSITCMLSCPTANITWTQNGTVIDASNGFLIVNTTDDNGDITESVLTRNMAGVGDTGRYQCGTTVQTIQSNDTADVFVYIEPEITQGPDDAARRIGESINFTCVATGVPLPDITWSSDSNGNIAAQSNVVDDMTIESQITLSNLQLGDFGMYTCTATNLFNVASETALLQCVPNIIVIVDGATDINTDGSYDIRSGTSFSITCMLSCPTATITWTQNGSIIDASNGFTIVDNGDITQSVLTRNMAGVGDTGRYQCSTTVQTIQSNDTADVFVYINPEITRGPDDAARRIGESINFTCDATGVPLPVITWSSDSNGNITAQSNVLDDMTIESQITLSNLQLGDFGMYTCTANNPFNVASETALLQCVPNITVIVDGATDVNTDGSYDIRSGTSFNITCMLSCPTATITWTQNGSIIDASNGFTIVNNGDITQSVLTRNMAGVGDTGRYQCSTTVQTIQSNDTADVFVYIVPNITLAPMNMARKVGESVNFTCNATGVPLPVITWSSDTNDSITAQPGDIMIMDNNDGSTRVSVLTLMNLKVEDFQNYTCNATNAFGSDNETALLGMKPRILQGPVEVTQLVGLNVTFTCIATGIPIPTITWSSDNMATIMPSNIKIMEEDNTILSEILVANISIEDFVNYTCTAMNLFDSVNASAPLVNATIPVITVPPQDAVVLRGGNVTFSCTAIGLPAPSITWSNDVNDNITAISNTTGTSTTSTLMLTNLTASYFNQSYTCTASNIHNMTNSSAFLTEGMEAVILESPQDALQLVGRNVSFRCAAFGIPRPNITWIFTPLNDSMQMIMLNNGIIIDMDNSSVRAELNLTNITTRDFGMYSCVATNVFNDDIEMASLEQGIKAMIITLPQNRSAGVSENVTFQCIATGNRRPNIRWVRQDGMEFAGSQVTLNATTNASSLTITNVMSNNFTDYSCVAENIAADNIIETITKSDFANFTLYKAVAPSPPVNVMSRAVTSRTASISWQDGTPPNPVNPMTERYLVFLNGVLNDTTGGQLTVMLTGLIPFTVYNVTVQASNRIGASDLSESHTFTTMEEAPGAPPQNVVGQSTVIGSIELSWSPPPSDRQYGVIIRYFIQYQIYGSGENPIGLNISNLDNLNTTISELQSGVMYLVNITAVNSAGISQFPSSILIRTIPNPPDLMDIVEPTTLPSSDDIGTTSIIITLPYTSGSFSHAWVVAVRLSSMDSNVLSSNTSGYLNRAAFANFMNAQDDQPYIVAEIDASNYPRTFALGDNSSTAPYSDFPELDYNGPLLEGRYYSFFVRFFSPSVPEVRAKRNVDNRQYSVFTTTGFISVVATAITQLDDDSNTATIVGGVFGGLVAIILISVAILVVVFIVYRHWDGEVGPPPSRAGSKRFRDEDKPFHTDDTMELKAFEPNEARQPISVQEFENHVRARHKNSDNLFADEYELINIKSPRLSHEATSQAVNIAKNRYANINAYDQTRVRLMPYEGVDGSDYINANYIDGYKRKNAYVATQGPLPNTTEDFWRMVWEQESYTIVMLTNLMEKARVKCHQYWPQVGSVSYGNFTVTLIDSMEVANYCVRTLRLAKSDGEKNDEVREIKQFHYTSWPDFGVPEHPSPIITFMRRIAQNKPKLAGPVIIHCSAGVGRTGTLVTIQCMLEMIIDTGTLDIFNFVLGLRKQRSFMVQTEKQYIFIHDTILEAIKVGNTQIEVMNLRKKLNELSALDHETDQSGIEAEFSKLGDLEQVDTSQFSAATAAYNQNKNRFPHILPYDKHRVKLLMYPGIEGSDYINATFLDGYHQRDQYILTQGPMQNTVGDFWRMIWEYKVSCVAMLCQLQEKGVDQDQSYKYWPELSQVLHFADILIETSAEKTMGGYIMREISITNSKVNESRTINQFQYLDWQEDRCPNTASNLIDMIGWLTKMQYHRGGGPVVIHDCASVGRSATFCALKIVVEQVKTEGIIDVFYTVHTMRTRQPLSVRQIGQYHYIYNAVAEFLDSFDHYANFNDYKAH